MIAKNAQRPFIILLFFMVLTCLHFWMTSRYPELSGKASLGDRAALSALGFAPILEIKTEYGFIKTVLMESVNWLHTNKKGMSFAFLIGAFFLSLWPLLKIRRLRSGLGNSVLGMVLGAPLGICVNCAAPVARALHASGGAMQTSLAALVASPTLNVVVIMMAFSMFPFYLVVLKLVLTFVFILILVPLGCHIFFKKEQLTSSATGTCEIDTINTDIASVSSAGWGAALVWSAKLYFKNLFYLLKIALPLMILSGVLGSLLTTVIDWSSIEQIHHHYGVVTLLALLLALSLFGALLPSPMAFDVIISSALLQAGVPIQLVATFLFTLGSFSIYAFFIVWQSMSLRVAFYMMACTVLLGFTAGLIAPSFDRADYRTAYQSINAPVQPSETSLSETPSPDNYYDPIMTRSDKVISYAQIRPLITKKGLNFTPLAAGHIQDIPDNLQIESAPFAARATHMNTAFEFINGKDIGLHQPYTISYISGVPDALPQTSMGVAAADVHHDGWPDLLITSDPEMRPGLALFANIEGKTFIRQDLPLPQDMEQAVVVALVDLNADTWPDIVFSTYNGKNYVIYNQDGEFLAENLKQLSAHEKGTTMNMSFGDIDRDGDLDIVLGNWNAGPSFINYEASRNILLRQNEHGLFDEIPLPGASGESLTSIISDFNNDGVLDIYTGNDFIMGSYSDLLLLGRKDQPFKISGASTMTNIVGAQSTMSIDIGDVDSDLKPDYYIGQISFNGQYMHKMSEIADRNISYSTYCETDIGRTLPDCEDEMSLRLALARASHMISDACQGLSNEINKQKCLYHMSVYRDKCSLESIDIDTSEQVFNISKRYETFCNIMHKAYEEEALNDGAYHHLNAKTDSLDNVLLINKSSPSKAGFFSDQANARHVGFGAWGWNARFADLDNDGWEDLYIVNGHNITFALATNLFYRNKGAGQFEDKTTEFGLENHTNTSAFTFVDMDNDGDMDIVNIPTDAPIQAYENHTRHQAIQIKLRDMASKNTDALGAQITIYYTTDSKSAAQMRFIKGSGGYRSYNQPIAHFGLNQGARINHIDIVWPEGETQQISGQFDFGKRYRIIRARPYKSR